MSGGGSTPQGQPLCPGASRVCSKVDYLAHDTIVVLANLFPACFFVVQHRRKPLKVGIRDDVLAVLNGAIPAKETGFALKIYTSNYYYLKACKEGAPRVENIAAIVIARGTNFGSHRARPIMTTAPRFELLTGNNDNLGFAVRLKK